MGITAGGPLIRVCVWGGGGGGRHLFPLNFTALFLFGRFFLSLFLFYFSPFFVNIEYKKRGGALPSETSIVDHVSGVHGPHLASYACCFKNWGQSCPPPPHFARLDCPPPSLKNPASPLKTGYKRSLVLIIVKELYISV